LGDVKPPMAISSIKKEKTMKPMRLTEHTSIIISIRKLTCDYDRWATKVLEAEGFIEQLPKEGMRKYKVLKTLPIRDTYIALRNARYTDTATSIISGAYSDIIDLCEELSSWRDNIQGTGLENTDRYNTLDDAVSTLENISEPTIPEWFNNFKILRLPNLERHRSRTTRASNAKADIDAVVEEVSQILDIDNKIPKEMKDEIQECLNQIENDFNEVENVEFPSMY